MTILETIIQDGAILASNVVETTVLESSVVELVVLESAVVYHVGKTGPTGPTGPAGGSVQTYPAGQTLSTGRVVIIEDGAVFYFQHTNEAHQGRAYGVTITSASTIGADVDVQLGGERADVSFNFTANKVLWVGANGVVFDSLPAGGVIIQKAGVSAEDRRMLIDFSISTKINT